MPHSELFILHRSMLVFLLATWNPSVRMVFVGALGNFTFLGLFFVGIELIALHNVSLAVAAFNNRNTGSGIVSSV